MTIFIILLSFLVVFGVYFAIFYFLYRKFGKTLKKMFEILKRLPDTNENPKKYRKLDHFQQELDNVNKLLEKYKKNKVID